MNACNILQDRDETQLLQWSLNPNQEGPAHLEGEQLQGQTVPIPS